GGIVGFRSRAVFATSRSHASRLTSAASSSGMALGRGRPFPRGAQVRTRSLEHGSLPLQGRLGTAVLTGGRPQAYAWSP
ncbi:hypothetical protein, partial [Nocardioides sp. NPDC000441]|uniref:hypothetical protein n=1 Tax=Nocardioides sp. NPDC000441 TaxID=3154256 RepID=UPI003324F338